MIVEETSLPGVLLLTPKIFGDARGCFFETWNRRRFAEAGLDHDFVQDNVSVSQKGILRGLHFQHPGGQGKLVQALRGEVFDVAVDVRRGSPTFGRWFGLLLSEHNRQQLFIPAGFAHGFCVTSEIALFCYKCTDFYSPATEFSVRWDDPAIGIDWPVTAPELSAKDAAGVLLGEIPPESLPEYR